MFGRSDWAMMFILSRSGKTYARLRFNVGPGGHVQVPVQVDYSQPFGASDQAAWEAEYKANVHPEPFLSGMFGQDAFEDEWLIESQAGADQDLPWETLMKSTNDPDDMPIIFSYSRAPGDRRRRAGRPDRVGRPDGLSNTGGLHGCRLERLHRPGRANCGPCTANRNAAGPTMCSGCSTSRSARPRRAPCRSTTESCSACPMATAARSS